MNLYQSLLSGPWHSSLARSLREKCRRAFRCGAGRREGRPRPTRWNHAPAQRLPEAARRPLVLMASLGWRAVPGSCPPPAVCLMVLPSSHCLPDVPGSVDEVRLGFRIQGFPRRTRGSTVTLRGRRFLLFPFALPYISLLVKLDRNDDLGKHRKKTAKSEKQS